MVSVLLSCIPLQNQVGHSSWQGICSLLSKVCHQPSSAWVGDTQNVIRLEKYLMASFCILWVMVQILEDPWRTSISWIDCQVICETWSITGHNNFECCVWRVSFQVGGCYLFYNVLIWDRVVPKINSNNYYVVLIFTQAFYIINNFLGKDFKNCTKLEIRFAYSISITVEQNPESHNPGMFQFQNTLCLTFFTTGEKCTFVLFYINTLYVIDLRIM